MKSTLTIKQKRFAVEYVKGDCGNATEAAIKAGYKEKTARIIASENLTKPNIKAEISRLRAAVEKKDLLSIYERKKIFAEIAQGKRPARAVKTETKEDGSTLKIYMEPGVGLDGLNKMEHIYTSEGQGAADEMVESLFDFIRKQGRIELTAKDGAKEKAGEDQVKKDK
jgi:phage terminase small subunit